MVNKKNFIIIFLFVFILSFSIVSAPFTSEEVEGGADQTEIEAETPADIPPESGVVANEEMYDFSDMEDEGSYDYLTVNDIPETTTIDTTIGSFSNYQLTNALFTMGFLAQASLISFENNNNLFFGSIFDNSKFQLTLDEEGEAEILQKNGIKDLGKVYISMDSGNLTQDDVVTFIPEGNDPTYIYYNTTEIEFDDGDVYYYDESVTNKDDTDKSTSVLFDENGFTRVEIHPENNYTIGDYIFYNSGREEIWACKDDSLCDIIIADSFIINGRVNLYYQDMLVIESLHINNVIELNYQTKNIIYNNNKPNGNEEDLAYLYNSNYKILETNGMTYSMFTEESYPNLFETYSSELNSINFEIKNNILTGENFEENA